MYKLIIFKGLRLTPNSRPGAHPWEIRKGEKETQKKVRRKGPDSGAMAG